VQDAFKIID